jgi:predicted dehydrogenase
MEKFNVGIIGIGDISDVYINNLNNYDIVNVFACASRNLKKAKKKAEEYSIPKPYANSKELLADPEIDIILNLTPPAVHSELNIKALKAGKHVYTEKPLAAKFKDGKKIIELAKDKNLYVGSAPDTFLGGRLQTCRKIIDDGRIGDIIGASAFVVSHGHEWFHPNPEYFYKEGAGPILDIGPYYISALLSLLGSINKVSAMSTRAFETRTIESKLKKGQSFNVEVDTHITANLKFSNNAVGTLIASFDVWDSELPRIEIYGTKGTICINDIDPANGPNIFGGKVLLRTRKNYRWETLPREKLLSDWIEVPVKHRFNSISHQKNSRGIGLIDMAYAINEKRDARASGQMALHTLEVMEAILKSAREDCYYKVKSRFTRPEPLPEDFLKEN